MRDCIGGNAEDIGDIWFCCPPATPMATSDVYRNSGSEPPPVGGATVLGVAGGILFELETFPMNHDYSEWVISVSCTNNESRVTHRHPSSVSSIFFDSLH